MKSIKRDNSGFSLVELLIAIVIIAIVLTPFYANFRESNYLNGQAKKTMDDTNMASNIMEGLSAYTPEEIILGFCSYDTISGNSIDGIHIRNNRLNIMPNEVSVEEYGELKRLPAGGYEKALVTTNFAEAMASCDYSSSIYTKPIVPGSTTKGPLAEFLEVVPQASGKYYFYAQGVQQARGKYDLIIELDASSASGYSGDLNEDGIIDESASEVYGYNDYDEAVIANLNPMFDGVYTENIQQKENAAVQFLTQKTNASLSMVKEDFYPVLERDIVIDIEYDAVTKLSKVVVRETYSVDSNFKANSSGQNVKIDNDFSGNLERALTDNIVFDGAKYKQEPREIYIYYTANYKSTSSALLDHFIINNPDEVPVNIHLVRIKSDETSVPSNELNYAASVAINETSGATEKTPGFQTQVYSNLRDNLNLSAEDNADNRKNFTTRIYLTINGTHITSATAEYNAVFHENGGVSTKSEDRLYSVKMYVYDEGAAEAGFPADKFITEFTGNSMQ